MCELCSTDKAERDKAVKRHERFADDLVRLADNYRSMAKGRINPHSDAAHDVGLRAKHIVRELVAELV